MKETHPKMNFCENVSYGIMNIPYNLNKNFDRNIPRF